jgi:alanyl-tRNA synthetase
MLGNFAFGDYYKQECILWGWEFMTQVMALDPQRLWAAIFVEDNEAGDIWEREIGLSREKIIALDRDNNWWGPVAATGACGPCSEIYYDLGEQVGCGKPDCLPGCDCDRFLEVWNFVFTEFYKHEDGSFSSLPTKNIDTGMGLERLALVIQEKSSCFDTDLFVPLVAQVKSIAAEQLPSKAKLPPESEIAFRIIADHARAFTFMITDGVLPSNEGRGYVLRRFMRRAVTQGQRLGIKKSFLASLVPKVVELMSSFYPELLPAQEHIERVAQIEEGRFRETLEAGWQRLEEQIQAAKAEGKTTLAGDQVFRLHDTYGFPRHLTQEFAEQAGLKIDEDGFRKAMEAQRQASLQAQGTAAAGGKVYADILQELGATAFLGYENLALKAKVVALLQGGQRVKSSTLKEIEVILDQTPFYAESGGQVGDIGRLEGETASAEVLGPFYGAEGLVVHHCRLLEGELREGDVLEATVDVARRDALRRSHTATHLVHYALRQVLGRHVTQSGSLVEPDAFRFDFSHFAAPAQSELEEIEALVNNKILENHNVTTEIMPLDRAQASGATALFGEKYGSLVRVVQVGDFSKELCAGTHVSSTGEIGCFRLLSEGSIGSGLRRLTAVIGHEVRKTWLADETHWKEVAALLQASSKDEVAAKIVSLKDSLETVAVQLDRYRSEAADRAARELASAAVSVGSYRLVIKSVKSSDEQFLERLCDQVSAETAPSLVLLAAFNSTAQAKAEQNTIPIVCKLSPQLAEHGLHAGKIVAQVAATAGGKGGGRPLFAKGAAKDSSQLLSAFKDLEERLKGELLE